VDEGKWGAVVQQLKPGDFVLIQFGHNDPGPVDTGKARGSLPGIGEETQTVRKPDGAEEVVHTFGWYLRKYISDTRTKGATPIVLSVTPRNIWVDGKVERGLGHFREWAAEVAHQENADYVDLSGIVAREYQKLGEDKVKQFFPLDHTHTNLEGATLNARSVVAGLKALPDAPLTSYFSSEGEAVESALESTLPLPANSSLPTLWIIGDSTVRNGQGDGANGQWGWGDEIAGYFNTAKINIVNRALGGRSSRTYYEFHWPKVLSMIKPGDFVMMQFGHNDSGPLDDKARARGTLPGNGDETREIDNPITRKHEVVHTYGWYLRQIIQQGRAKKATPIVCSLVPRKIWNGDAIRREVYIQWAKEAAQQEHTLFINLNEIVAEQYDSLGPEKVDGLFGDPHTHTNLEGAKLNAESVVEGLKGLNHDPLRKYLSVEAQNLKSFKAPTQVDNVAAKISLSPEETAIIQKDTSRHFGDAPENPGPKATNLSSAMKPQAIEVAMRKVADWQLSRSEPYFDRIWTWSVLYSGFLAASTTLHDPRYNNAMEAMGEKFQWQLRSPHPNADDQSIGQAYLELYLKKHNPEMKAPTQTALDELLTSEPVPVPKNQAQIPWWWCDALFMAPPVWSRMYAELPKPR
jgi:lysophospholipase L1-like esterase